MGSTDAHLCVNNFVYGSVISLCGGELLVVRQIISRLLNIFLLYIAVVSGLIPSYDHMGEG